MNRFSGLFYYNGGCIVLSEVSGWIEVGDVREVRLRGSDWVFILERDAWPSFDEAWERVTLGLMR